MPDIVLTTLNAKYIHAAFGLRYLLANLGALQPRAAMLEFDINQRPVDIAEKLLQQKPLILGISVYIWNVAAVTELVAILKRLSPELIVVLGGPEVSYETESQSVVKLADFAVSGEGDLAFRQLCADLLDGRRPSAKLIKPPLPDFTQIAMPYELYTAEDIAHRITYVEASRGCPFSCEFCLSSLDIPVRQVPLESFLAALQSLLDRGATHLKFVDRTFNLNVATSSAILGFLLQRYRPGLLFHFEMVPDRLPEALRDIISRFPAGALQFEVGIQTFNEEVADRISRRQNYARLAENLAFLRQNTAAHIHADLIFGLPGESMDSFAAGFDRLVRMGPQEIQVGVLKKLRGAPIGRHDSEWKMVYNPHGPYEILSTSLIGFADMQRLRRFSRYWDLLANSGNFVETAPLIWAASSGGATAGPAAPRRSPFYSFLGFSDWLFDRVGRTDSIALPRLMELVFNYLITERRLESGRVALALWNDCRRAGRKDKPSFLCEYLPPEGSMFQQAGPGARLKRQARHAAMRRP